MPALIAPAFPEAGYLPTRLDEVIANRSQQQQQVDAAHCQARQEGQPSPCVQVLNISLFFDGTNNHGDSDDKANPVNSSNVRRLFNASIGSLDGRDWGYYSYYMQGVGTVFKEIGEDKPSSSGLSFAAGGEDRILWGLTRLVDALRRAYSAQNEKLDAEDAYALVKAMQYSYVESEHGVKQQRSTTRQERRELMQQQLAPLLAKRQNGYKPEILSIKLYVYGFSRGAAEARAFIWRLREQLDEGCESLCGIPLSVEFLGLFDTVAAVGLTELAPGAEGHMGWADGTMKLPPEAHLPRRCAHLVSAHEQRLCFALDSIAIANRSYPACTLGEWVYPGMHSDVGGGYPPGDQGKAREGQGMLLSQLPLLHMYRLAFDAGAPLQVNKELLHGSAERIAQLQQREQWRFMDKSIAELYFLDSILKQRFEAWRQQASASSSLEDILQFQTAQITAWRIARYAGGLHEKGGPGYENAPFYQHSRDTPSWQAEAEKDAWKKQSKQGKSQAVTLEAPVKNGKPTDGNKTYTPNINKEYEATQDKTQLKEGAKDFADDYVGRTTLSFNVIGGLATFFTGISRVFSDDCGEELVMLREDGEGLYNAVTQNPELMALYDEHVHDSRAWFMHAALAKREPHGTYLRYRTVFFTDGNSNKQLICRSPRVTDIKRKELEQSAQQRISRSSH
ncbi:DUF2235 domain-containing protein [Aquitalea palustris]|uniref:DUF2235 domain-containing protein n=1 Tax=Aquitalea palustris TaxID=2480983 RepID=A0A454JFR0_9NEIS|nr:DUF2235 domain-containing protein [Aquitalea palustris]RMC94648.1 DUF2235 domain-containing protein [Aquitalea palustris]